MYNQFLLKQELLKSFVAAHGDGVVVVEKFPSSERTQYKLLLQQLFDNNEERKMFVTSVNRGCSIGRLVDRFGMDVFQSSVPLSRYYKAVKAMQDLVDNAPEGKNLEVENEVEVESMVVK
jgi:hypothetical protein